jgi:hypothetical protein
VPVYKILNTPAMTYCQLRYTLLKQQHPCIVYYLPTGIRCEQRRMGSRCTALHYYVRSRSDCYLYHHGVGAACLWYGHIPGNGRFCSVLSISGIRGLEQKTRNKEQRAIKPQVCGKGRLVITVFSYSANESSNFVGRWQ